MDERRLEHDDEVRVGDRVVAADRPVGDARECAQRRAAPLRAVLGEGLHALAVAQQRQRQDLGGRLGALAGARMPADLGQLAHRSALVERASRALRLGHGLDDARAAVDGVARGKDLRVRRPPLLVHRLRAASRNSSRGRWPIAFTTVSTGTTNSLPGTGSGRRRPLSSGAPSRISAQRTPSTRPSPTNADGVREEADLDALVAGELDLVLVRRHLVLGAPVEQERDVGAEPLRLDRDVDGGVAAADDGDAAVPTVGGSPVFSRSMNGSDSQTPSRSSPS